MTIFALLRIDYRSDHRWVVPPEWDDTYNDRLKIEMVWNRGPFCARCLKWKDVRDRTVDHRYTKWMGYQKYYQTPENRQLMCLRCHRLKIVMEDTFKNRVGGSSKNSYFY